MGIKVHAFLCIYFCISVHIFKSTLCFMKSGAIFILLIQKVWCVKINIYVCVLFLCVFRNDTTNSVSSVVNREETCSSKSG